MEIYDSEEQQVEALKRWWKENGTSAITGAVIAVVLVIGWNAWQSYHKQQEYKASDEYTQLFEALRAEKYDSVEKLAADLTQAYGNTPYADLAVLVQAKTDVEQNKMEEAKNLYQNLMQTGSNDEIKHVARLRLVRLMWATGEYEKGLQLIAEADMSTTEGFSSSYDELTGDLYVALGRLGEARTAYRSALRSGSSSPFLELKLNDISPQEISDTAQSQ